MSPVLSKKQMTEEDIKLNYITPAISVKWKDLVTMETKITDGKINLKGNLVVREKPKKADYVLYLNSTQPIAIVEAKDNNHSVSYGLQQAMTYATMMDVPFAYSSNGDAFQEHDFLTGQEKQIPLDQFPSPDELKARFEAGANKGAGLSDPEKKIINQPYYTSQKTHSPRYYQRNAINRTVDAIARGQKRLLLVMATGTGKTYTAFQIVYRLLKSGLVRKVLYLADRNILVDQSIQQDFAPLEKTIHKINFAKDDPTTITSHEVYFSLYQQLSDREEEGEESGENETVNRLAQLFRPDFFDLVIVDECHRGSAGKDSNWRKILEYFSSAAQIGMTATPKETKYVSNIDYFGEPVYTYSLKEGIEDGFLAPFKVINIRTNIGEGWRPFKGQLDKNGQEIEDRIYTNSDFDYNIILEDRTNEVAQEITTYLKSTGRMQKTIVFCATEEHAERMRIALNNLNADMVQQYPDYVVRITGSDVYGKSKLDYFISVASPVPVIATTSKLLSTGADCKMTKLIVLDQMIGSMTEFKQIIGRGTRIREKEGKILSPQGYQELVGITSGTAMKKFNKTDLKQILVPVPPLAEQKRIVAKIEELQPLIDRYEKAWTRLEEFNKQFPGDLQKSILQMAIQGKLVEQWPEEETGEDLYQQIQAEKQKLIREGKIKKEKPLPEITEEEKPFDIPENWIWARMDNITLSILAGKSKRCNETPPQNDEIGIVKVSAVTWGSFQENESKTCISMNDWVDDYRIHKNDFLISRANTKKLVGACVIVEQIQKRLMLSDKILRISFSNSIDLSYILYIMRSGFLRGQIELVATGTSDSMKNISQNNILNLVIPLPPLAEQKRIVKKIEELLPLCQKLQ